MFKKIVPLGILIIVFVICYLSYSAGLKGGFLFDDYPNLQDLGNYGDINSWEKITNFVFNGFSGPTGRPISLASFLINDNTWPSVAFSFKLTNLYIHLINGLLLFWATLLILINYNYREKEIIWIAVLTCTFWLLHPYFVSTTLYVVQRMAQLATLFSLIGIIGYLKGRLLLASRPKIAYVIMTVSMGMATILATYSKENGALLPLLILVVEFCNPSTQNKPMWEWRFICLWLPSIAIAALLFHYIDFSGTDWPNRNFNQAERLLSESRIVSEYLFNLFIPEIEGRGLFQDGYQVSKNLFTPITTLFSIIFLITLTVTAFIYRKKYPLFSLAILFFFAAHLMESSVIGLELYFEHRNYLAALFLFLPLASGLVLLSKKIDYKLVIFISILIISMLALMTWQRAVLWSNTDNLELYWAKNTPNSPRAQNAIGAILVQQGRYEEANTYIEQASQRLPDSALLSIRLLLQRVYTHQAKASDFDKAIQQLSKQPFDAQAVQGLRTLVEYVVLPENIDQYGPLSLRLIAAMQENANYKDFPLFLRLMPYLQAQIYAAQNQPIKAYKHYRLAMSRYNDVEAGLMMVAEMASKGYYPEALNLLNQANSIYQKQDPKSLKRSKEEYDFEIPRLRQVIKKMLDKQVRDNHEN